MILQRTTSNWFPQDVQFSVRMMLGYVKSIERSAKTAVDAFNAEKQTQIVPHEPEDGQAEVYDVYGDLDGQTWDLDHLFQEYFPNLQRWGALITLFTFFETTMEDLCDLFAHELGLTVNVRDLKGQGVERAVQYLQKVVGLQFDNTNATWREIKIIQKIRNMIVHHAGKFAEQAEERDRDILGYVEESKKLTYQTEVTLLDGFLSHVVDLFEREFLLIHQLIHRRHST